MNFTSREETAPLAGRSPDTTRSLGGNSYNVVVGVGTVVEVCVVTASVVVVVDVVDDVDVVLDCMEQNKTKSNEHQHIRDLYFWWLIKLPY